MKNISILLLIIFVVFFSGLELYRNISPARTYDGPFLIIDDRVSVELEIADNFELRRQGLSDWKELGEYRGMLFVFEDKQRKSFWMKNMLIPLDIIWISEGEVVNVNENLEPEGEYPVHTYSSVLPVEYGLEVNGGFIEKNRIKIGDKVDFFLD